MFNYEFDDRFAGRYFGKYRGVVADNQDPKGLFRIKAIVPSIMDDQDSLGWAFPTPSMGGSPNVGDTWLPASGDYVWIEFEGGDTSAPLWSPGPWAIRGGSSTAPKHARAEPDVMDYAVRDMGNTSPSQFQGSYGRVRAIQGHDGSMLEFDATPSAERVLLAHFSGSRVEMFSDGGVEEVCIANNRKLVTGKQNVHVGAREELITGNLSQRVEGLVDNQFVGNVTESYSSLAQTGKNASGVWDGSYDLEVGGGYAVNGLGNGSLSFAGQLTAMVGANMQLAVMEYLSISASASTTGYGSLQKPQPSIVMQGYNGPVAIKATDATGLAQMASLTMDASVPGTIESTWKISSVDEAFTHGQITLNNLVSPAFGSNVILAGGGEPLVLGKQLVALLSDILTILQQHTHPTGTGMSGMDANVSTVAKALELTATLALPRESGTGILSGYVEAS